MATQRSGSHPPTLTEDLEGIAVFVRAVEAGSFSAAAREAGISPSAISKRIARLEGRLGVMLFSRTTRRLALTEAGQEFYARGAQGIAGIAEAVEAVSRFRRKPAGLLRVRAPQAFGRLHIAPLISGFLARYPDIRIDLMFGQPDREFMDERLDVLVASADPPDVNMARQMLVRIDRVTCAAPSYIARAGRPRDPADLVRHNCLMFTGSASVENEWVLHRGDGVRRIRVSGSFRTNDFEAIYQAVLGGVGVAHMPTFVVGPALKAGKLVALFRDSATRTGASMNAYYPMARHRLPKVEAFVAFLVERFRDRGAARARR